MNCTRNTDGTITIDADSAEKIAYYVSFSDFLDLGHNTVSPKHIPLCVERVRIATAILGVDLTDRIDTLTGHDASKNTTAHPEMRERLRTVFELDTAQALD